MISNYSHPVSSRNSDDNFYDAGWSASFSRFGSGGGRVHHGILCGLTPARLRNLAWDIMRFYFRVPFASLYYCPTYIAHLFEIDAGRR